MTLLVLVNGSVGQRIPLDGSTISQVESILRPALAATGLDGRRYTLLRHFELPPHPVARGQAFDTTRIEDFAELAVWYGNAVHVLGELRTSIGGSDIRCWPHHFDIATLATVAPGRTSSAGMMPGDETYPEPYYYVNAYPPIPPDRLTTRLDGGGTWHTEGWTGAVLTGSRLTADGSAQEAQARAFLESATSAVAGLLGA